MILSIVQNCILQAYNDDTHGWLTSGFSPFSGPLVKISTTQKWYSLKLQPLYIVFMGYLSTILAHKPLEFVLTHENVYLSLDGPLPVVEVDSPSQIKILSAQKWNSTLEYVSQIIYYDNIVGEYVNKWNVTPHHGLVMWFHLNWVRTIPIKN